MPIWSAEIKELEKLFQSFKGQLPELEKELGQLIHFDDPNVILLYSRRCLEVIITDLCECELKRPRKTEPLQGIIDKLNKEEKVPSHIIASMHSLNSLSTFGTHPKDFDPEQVKPVLVNLDIIIKWYLKYKEPGIDIKEKPAEEIRQEIKSTDDAKKSIQIPKKSLIGLVSGFILLIVIVFAVLFFTKIIGGGKQKKEPDKSIAVLPFRNFSEDSNQDVRSDALTNEIINHLYKIKSFDRIIPFTSVIIYKKTDKKILQIADELKANYILEGTYQKIGDSLRITAHLIEPGKDKYIWQNGYNKPYKEIISIQSDIALQIAANVNAFITVSEKQNIQKIPTSNLEAYDLLQRAILISTIGSMNVNKGLDLALKAISLDHDYADAYAAAGIFSMYSASSPISSNDMQSAIKDASLFIEKALKLDPNNSLAHFAMGNIYEWGRWNYIEAEKEYLKVKELSPNMMTSGVNDLIGEFFLKMNRLESANLYLNKVMDTREFMNGEIYLKLLVLSGRNQEAYNYINKNYAFLKQLPVFLGTSLIWFQDFDSAKLYLESAIKSGNPQMRIPRYLAYLALAYYKTDQYIQAKEIIDQLTARSNVTLSGSPEYYIGWYYSGIGEIDSAFVWLEKAFINRSPEMPWLKQDPFFKNLKGDNRYWDLYERTGHKAYDDYINSKKTR